MITPIDIFCEIPCLTERSIPMSGLALHKKWFRLVDRRAIGQCLQKFIDYNVPLFDFLGVQPIISGADQNVVLSFRSSEFIGVIPLRSSDNGKQMGDFVVTPRFSSKNRYEDYSKILDLLGSEISHESIHSLPLMSGRNFRPPLYLEAIRFIASLEKLIQTSWRKFDTNEQILSHPSGHVNWNKYAHYSSKIENQLRYPTNKNILSQHHIEYSKIKYVFDLCKVELLSSKTPQQIRYSIRSRISFIDEKLYLHRSIYTSQIRIRNIDSPIIKECKASANRILNHSITECTAWKVDFADVFEKFVQHIFKETAKETGGRLFSNFRIGSRTPHRHVWELRFLEPDAVYKKGDSIVFIDAKYKSHMYNKFTSSKFLKEEYRHDLHQLLAYMSFGCTSSKYGFLCYPSENTEIKQVTYINDINGSAATVYICGFHMQREVIHKAKELLINTLTNL